MSATNHAASVCSTRGEMQSQANPIQTRTGSVGRPSGMVPGGAQTPDPNHTNGAGNSRIGSDAETADLVAQLDGLTVRHLTAADVQREAITAEMKRMTWRDGAEGGGL